MRACRQTTQQKFMQAVGFCWALVLLSGCASSPSSTANKADGTATNALAQAMRSVIVPKLHIRPADLMWRYQDGKIVYDDPSEIRDPKRYELRARNLSMFELFELVSFLSDGATAVPSAGHAEQEKALIAKLKGITIPEVTFRPPATIFDAVEFFHQASVDYDDPLIPVQSRGINFAVKNPYPLTFKAAPERKRKEPMIAGGHDSFCTLYDALTNLCANANARFLIRDRTVVIYPACAANASAGGGR